MIEQELSMTPLKNSITFVRPKENARFPTIVSLFNNAFPMSAHAFLTELIAAWNDHNKQRLLDLYHPDFEGEDLSEGKRANGLYDAGRMIDYVLTAFPDLEMTLLEWGTDGDKVFCFWQASGHQRGRLMNIPPTGKAVSFMGSTFITLKDGKIIRSRRIWDVATALRNIGLLPEPTTFEYR
jgi:steroid delta-isomerase-like uncharacterized protein